MRHNKKAQTLLEYTILIGIVMTAVFAMSTQVRRGALAVIRSAADQLSPQNESEQIFNDAKKGYLISAVTTTRSTADKQVTEGQGKTNYQYSDRTETFSESISNGGFTNRE